MIKLNKNLLLQVPIIIILFTQNIFSPYLDYNELNNHATFDKVIGLIEKLFPLLFLIFTFYKVGSLRKYHLIFFLFTISYITYLIFESLYLYQSFFEFPHVFFKIINLTMICSFLLFYQKSNRIDVKLIMNIIFYGILIKILINPGIVSLGAFVSHIRLVPSESVFLLLLPALYFFNKYILEFEKLSLLKFIILFFLIIYFQHRSVWTASFAAFALNFFILIRQNALNFKKVLPYVLIFSFLFLMLFSLVATKSPEIVKKIDQEIINILNPQEDKTGSWRIMQYEAYKPFIAKHLAEGMRLKGFELPVQFFNSEHGTQLFTSNTGHHFHSYYVETLFYFGFIVLAMTMIIILIPIVKIIANNNDYTPAILSFTAFVFSGLIFGLAYRLPIYYWPILGITLTLYNLEKIRLKEKV